MTLETFFAKFDLFADAPDAVAKMRELVLQLAVTGKLVAQDNRDEPASSLLESTKAERAKLLVAKKIKSRPTSSVELDEQPFEVPSSWAWARLSDVGYELGQKVPDKRFTYIDVGGIDSDKGRISDRVEKLEPGDAPSRARKCVAHGTVIYSTVRPYLLNIAIVDQDFDPEPIASTAFGILHPFEGVNNRYLFYWLRSAPFTAYVQAGMKGMAYPAINDEKFYSGYIALPPLAEQERIVAKVDELMALCDRLEAQQQQRETRHAALARASLARFADAPTPANLQFLFHPSYAIEPADLRKAILTLAVDGSLIKADSNETQFGEVVDLLGGYAFKSEWFTNTSGIRLVRNQNISHGELDWTETEYLPEDRAREFEKWALRPGDLVLSLNRPFISTGLKLAWITDADCPSLLVQRIVCLRPDPERLLAKYLYLWCNAPQFYRDAHVVPSSGVPYIAPNRVAQMRMQLPPLAEQRRIVAKVAQLMALVEALETQLTASRATAANLLSALVAELTTKNGNSDEA